MIVWECCVCGKNLESVKELVTLRVTPLPNQPRFHHQRLYCSQRCEEESQ